MTRGELARLTGCNPETVRYYEKAGLMPAPPRSPGGHRQYDDSYVRRLYFILRSRELGFSIEELRGLLAMVDGNTYTCAEVRDISLEHLRAIHRKIADLRRLERTMAAMVAECDGGAVPECPVIDALFQPRGRTA